MDLLDFSAAGESWLFRLGSEKEGEVWLEVLGELKAAIPATQRSYWPDKNHLWGVLMTDHNRAALIDIFDNAKLCIEIIENSPRLPGFGEEGNAANSG